MKICIKSFSEDQITLHADWKMLSDINTSSVSTLSTLLMTFYIFKLESEHYRKAINQPFAFTTLVTAARKDGELEQSQIHFHWSDFSGLPADQRSHHKTSCLLQRGLITVLLLSTSGSVRNQLWKRSNCCPFVCVGYVVCVNVFLFTESHLFLHMLTNSEIFKESELWGFFRHTDSQLWAIRFHHGPSFGLASVFCLLAQCDHCVTAVQCAASVGPPLEGGVWWRLIPLTCCLLEE